MNPRRMQLLTHENGIQLDDCVKRLFPNHAEHDPSDLAAARELAEDSPPCRWEFSITIRMRHGTT